MRPVILWSYVQDDWNERPESAVDAVPRAVWMTREAAMRAAEADFADDWRAWREHDETMEEAPRPLAWELQAEPQVGPGHAIARADVGESEYSLVVFSMEAK